jgi:ankyrin repeat protein
MYNLFMQELMEAVRQGDAARVTELLDREPSLLRASANGVSAILMAMYCGHAPIARLFIDRGAALTFHEACAVGDQEAAERLLAIDGSLIDRLGDDGFPPLGLAIFFRHPDLARRLIEAGANVSTVAANAQRVAPIHAAAAVSDYATMALLLARGADPNARQQLDYTPIFASASRGDLAVGRLLVEHGADVTASSTDGKSVADIARDRGQLEFAEWIEGLGGIVV